MVFPLKPPFSYGKPHLPGKLYPIQFHNFLRAHLQMEVAPVIIQLIGPWLSMAPWWRRFLRMTWEPPFFGFTNGWESSLSTIISPLQSLYIFIIPYKPYIYIHINHVIINQPSPKPDMSVKKKAHLRRPHRTSLASVRRDPKLAGRFRGNSEKMENWGYLQPLGNLRQ